ncbi:MAG: phosphoenolpyruvate--protein phosphotransferase [Gemmatimonadetes bacterium]|nr:phosphoenolpyruvate--protein phosphotransferase [Gemmatimonadota bacterium]MYE68438.1 phosphoenolpyruvate--protein phosphotransferase [Gemmatimonadota bacterium]MYJ69936.1 phosphoenolpyruvate--protein phosphotransferase [Gemmatimonadota bacterium]
MSSPGLPTHLDGFPASDGIALGRVRRVDWRVPEAPRATVRRGARRRELDRLEEALRRARAELEEIKGRTEARLGTVEARIFDPQILMLEDPEVVEGTKRYISENRVTAARAFEWRMLELTELWARTSHTMVLDRLNDLHDVKLRVLGRLLGLPSPWDQEDAGDAVIVARDLTPSFVARLDPERASGLATDTGSRAAHWAILARSMEIPAVVGLGDIFDRTRDGQSIIVDGRSGHVVIDPDEVEAQRFEQRRTRISGWTRRVPEGVPAAAVTLDDAAVTLRANLDLPGEARRARELGAQGVGLFRTEFLAVGRRAGPGEEEQYRAYSAVAETFPSDAVLIRIFDLGGDKFPLFLRMPAEGNPFLGRRGVRVCRDEPGLFLTQLRAILRATVHGDVRVMVPLVNTTEEFAAFRELLGAAKEQLQGEGVPFRDDVKVGAMIETPAAALAAAELAAASDFLSIGTNDLVQYALAVDRTNTGLAHLFDPFHPAVPRLVAQVAEAGRSAGIEVSACGEMAAQPAGAVLLAGLGVDSLSVAWPSLPEITNLIRGSRMRDMCEAAAAAVGASGSADLRRALERPLAGPPDQGLSSRDP